MTRKGGMPKRDYPRYELVVGKCYYCQGVVRQSQVAHVHDASVQVFDKRLNRMVYVRRLVHSARSGYFCEAELLTRFHRAIGE